MEHTRSNSLSSQNINAQPAVIEVLDVDGASSESSDQVDVALVKKIVVSASETSVWLLLNFENNIAGLYARRLVTLAAELDLGAATNTSVDMDVEDLAIDDGLLASALLAAILVLDLLTLAVTVGADSLETLNHGTHLAHHGLHTVAITSSASLDGALLTTKTLALGADDGALQSQLGDLAAVDVLQGDLVSVVNGAGLGRATVHTAAEHASHASEATTAEELSEQVLGSHATSTGTTFEAGFTILIVNLSLLGVGEDFVGVGDFLELVLSGGVVCVLVYFSNMLDEMILRYLSRGVQHTRVVLKGTSLVSLLEFGLSGRGRNL